MVGSAVRTIKASYRDKENQDKRLEKLMVNHIDKYVVQY